MQNNTSIIKTIWIHARPASVWNVLTDITIVRIWVSDAEVKVITDWSVGSPFVIRGNVNGSHEYKGIILQNEKEKVFQYTSWSKISRLPDVPENYTVITFELEAVGDTTRVTLTHSNLHAQAATEHAEFYWRNTLPVIKELAEKQSPPGK